MVKRTHKSARQMERHFKGIANHYRIRILLLVNEEPDMSVGGITAALEANRKTISQHTRYLVQAGLLNKHYKGRKVLHTLSPYGEIIVRFVKSFRKIT